MNIRHNFIKTDLMPLLKLGVPLILTGVIQSSLYFVENVFLAQLGENALAAGGLVNWLFATLIVIFYGTFGAVNILIAHKYGAQDKIGITAVLRDGLLLSVLLTIPIFILLWNMSSIFYLFKQSTELVVLAKIYLHALAWGLFPKFILIILFEFLIGLGHSRMTLVLSVLTVPVYIVISYLLIFGKWGFPALGIAGAGWGITFGDWIIAFLLSFYLFFSKEYRSYLRTIFTSEKTSYIWEIISLGFPIGVMYSIEVAFFFAATLIMGTLGVSSLAANQVTMQYLGPLMGVIFSIAQAVTVRMGHQIGAKEFLLIKNTAFAGVFISACFMCVVAIIYWIFPRALLSVDFDLHHLNAKEMISLTTDFLFIAAFFQIFECIRITLFGALRALKDTRFTLLTSIITFWGISLPLGYLLAIYFNWGGAGIWWAMVLGAGSGVGILFWRFNIKLKEYLKFC